VVNTSAPVGGNGDGSAGSWTDGAEDFAAAERLRAAAQHRRRQRWQHERHLDDRSIAPSLRAALGQPVTLHLLSGATAHGVVAEVGEDVVALEPATGPAEPARGVARRRWVALDAVVAAELRGAPGDEPAAEGAVTLAEVVEDLRDREVTIVLRSGATVSGTLAGNGATLTLRGRDGRSHTLVPADAVESLGP